MFRNRKSMLEARIARLEKLVSNKFSNIRKRYNKFESVNSIKDTVEKAFKVLQDRMEDSGVEVFGLSDEGDHFEFDMQDIMDEDDNNYGCDDWECNYETISLTPNKDGTISVGLGYSNFSDDHLGDFKSAPEIVRAVMKYRLGA